MSDDMKPALTAEEWIPYVDSPTYLGSDFKDELMIRAEEVRRWESGVLSFNNEYQIERPHATAALCLYKQSYGFTQEEAEFIRTFDNYLVSPRVGDRAGDLMDSIAAKITALLPPA